MTDWVFRGERRRQFDDWWEVAKPQFNMPDDPKVQISGKQGDFMLACLRAYEQGRIDEREDAHEIRKEYDATGRVSRFSDVTLTREDSDE
jgi:hypothetical protein